MARARALLSAICKCMVEPPSSSSSEVLLPSRCLYRAATALETCSSDSLDTAAAIAGDFAFFEPLLGAGDFALELLGAATGGAFFALSPFNFVLSPVVLLRAMSISPPRKAARPYNAEGIGKTDANVLTWINDVEAKSLIFLFLWPSRHSVTPPQPPLRCTATRATAARPIHHILPQKDHDAAILRVRGIDFVRFFCARRAAGPALDGSTAAPQTTRST